MKIISVTMVRNESDIIELFVRYHARIVDHMIIVEHQSLDRTPEILGALRAEGLPLEIVRKTTAAFDQGKTTTQLMKRAIEKHGADWIVPLDADEFLTADGGPGIRLLLEKLSPEEVHRIFWKTYIPRAEDPQDIPSLFERVQYRRKEETKPVSKVIVPRAIAVRKDIFLGTGSHRIVNKRGRHHKKIPYCNASLLHLAHFPVRSASQITAKVLLGWPTQLASFEHTKIKGWHWKKMFDRLRSGNGLTAEDIEELGLSYMLPEDEEDSSRELVHDPIILPGGNIVLRYQEASGFNVVSALTDLAESLARELAEERKKALTLGAGIMRMLRKIRARLIPNLL